MKMDLESMFARFARDGDTRALGRVFDATAPELMRVARYLCPDQATADDVVSASYLEAIEAAGTYDPSRPLRPWLLGILANRIRTRRRSELRRKARERQDERTTEDPAEIASRRELDAICAAKVGALPEPYRQVIKLTLEHSLTPSQIADVLGRSPGTVRTQIARGMDVLRRCLPAGVVGALAVVVSRSSLRALRRRVVGPSAVPVAAVASACVVFAAIWMIPGEELAESELQAAPLATAPAVASVGVAESGRPAQRARQARIGRSDRARVVAHVRWDDGTPAAGRHLFVWPYELPNPFLRKRYGVTDASGRCVFEGLASTKAILYTHGRGSSRRLALAAGKEVRVEVKLGPSCWVEGTVVNENGDPVPRATLVASASGGGATSLPIGATDALGHFRVRLAGHQGLTAQKLGYVSSWSYHPERIDTKGEPLRLQITVGGRDARITGRATDPLGKPVAGAVVLVGKERFSTGFVTAEKPGFRTQSRPPVRLRTDANGAFVVTGLPQGRQRVAIRKLGYAPWSGELVLAAGGREDLLVRLEGGGTVSGRVTDVTGKPLPGVNLMEGSYGGFLSSICKSGPDGSFTLDSLPTGEVRLAAIKDEHGRARASLVLGARPVVWNPVLGSRLALFGRVVDANGKGLAGWRVSAWYAVDAWNERQRTAKTNGSGVFRIPDVGERAYRVTVSGPGARRESLTQRAVRAASSPLSLRVAAAAFPGGSFRARILDPSGEPVDGHVLISPSRRPERRGIPWIGLEKGQLDSRGWTAGEYDLQLRLGDGSKVSLGKRAARHDGPTDLGTVRLPARQKLSVEVVDGDVECAVSHVAIRDADGVAVFDWDPGKKRPLAPALAAGRYVVSVFVGATRACRLVDVGAGTKTLRVDLAAGTEHRVAIAADPPLGEADFVRCVIVDEAGGLRYRGHVAGDFSVNLLPMRGTLHLTATDGRAGQAAVRLGKRPSKTEVRLRQR